MERNKDEISNTVISTGDFEELFNVIRNLKTIEGSGKTYNSEELIRIIQLVKDGKETPEAVTRTYNLRDKVRQLLYIDYTLPRINTKEQLYAFVKELGLIPTSQGLVTSEDMKRNLDLVFNHSAPTNFITRKFGLRDKVEEILRNS